MYHLSISCWLNNQSTNQERCCCLILDDDRLGASNQLALAIAKARRPISGNNTPTTPKANHIQRVFGKALLGSNLIIDTAWSEAISCLRRRARVIAQALIGNRAIKTKTII
ncbi:MAG: hypothetical protein ACK6DQ_17305, partial [Planctomycetota bacterium]